MTREEKEQTGKYVLQMAKLLEDGCYQQEMLLKAVHIIDEVLEQELCDDVISRKSIKQKLQERHDFFVNAYGGFSNLPLNDKSRVDEITNCIAMVVNEPPVIPQEPFINKPCVSSEVCEHDRQKVRKKKEMNKRSKKLDQAYCNECGDLVSYTTKEEVIEDVNNDIPFQYRFPISRCVICGSEVADSLDYNYDKSDARWTAYLQAKENNGNE